MDTYILEAHEIVGDEQTLQRIEPMGVCWPYMRRDVYDYVRGCSCEMWANPRKKCKNSLSYVTCSSKMG